MEHFWGFSSLTASTVSEMTSNTVGYKIKAGNAGTRVVEGNKAVMFKKR